MRGQQRFFGHFYAQASGAVPGAVPLNCEGSDIDDTKLSQISVLNEGAVTGVYFVYKHPPNSPNSAQTVSLIKDATTNGLAFGTSDEGIKPINRNGFCSDEIRFGVTDASLKTAAIANGLRELVSMLKLPHTTALQINAAVEQARAAGRQQ